ncbi:HAD hydrolase-like protein [Leeia sp. TBRC 13508]|uniref:HAD hydrolase-like protein n=1 Tax=Leeia speluncae TaxID=2884804 RepID=A0ABS8DAP2_9NEIS|nr:HAD family hydrolase [Leeia speluncae]MCB6184991.1 HAD hydrolase-like protein [Leeia speluncae]
MAIKVVVFDLGGVLFDWHPDYYYQSIIPDEAERQHFLSQICNGAWRLKQDAGQPLSEGTEELVAAHPAYEQLIRQFYPHWHLMLKGTLPEGMQIFETLQQNQVPVFSLTNWAAETWPYAIANYPFLQGFKEIVVSGIEGMVKPDFALYERMQSQMEKHYPDLKREEVFFIDDTEVNIHAAKAFGWDAIHHTSAEKTVAYMKSIGLLG